MVLKPQRESLAASASPSASDLGRKDISDATVLTATENADGAIQIASTVAHVKATLPTLDGPSGRVDANGLEFAKPCASAIPIAETLDRETKPHSGDVASRAPISNDRNLTKRTGPTASEPQNLRSDQGFGEGLPCRNATEENERSDPPLDTEAAFRRSNGVEMSSSNENARIFFQNSQIPRGNPAKNFLTSESTVLAETSAENGEERRTRPARGKEVPKKTLLPGPVRKIGRPGRDPPNEQVKPRRERQRKPADPQSDPMDAEETSVRNEHLRDEEMTEEVSHELGRSPDIRQTSFPPDIMEEDGAFTRQAEMSDLGRIRGPNGKSAGVSFDTEPPRTADNPWLDAKGRGMRLFCEAEEAFETYGIIRVTKVDQLYDGIRLRIDGLKQDCAPALLRKITSLLEQPMKAIQAVCIDADRTRPMFGFHTIYLRKLPREPVHKDALLQMINTHLLRLEGIPPLTVRLDSLDERPAQPILLTTEMSAHETTSTLKALRLTPKSVTAHGTKQVRVNFYKAAHAARFLSVLEDRNSEVHRRFPEARPFDLGTSANGYVQVRVCPAPRETSGDFWIDSLHKIGIPVRSVRHDRLPDGSPNSWCSIMIRHEDVDRLRRSNIRENNLRETTFEVMPRPNGRREDWREPPRTGPQQNQRAFRSLVDPPLMGVQGSASGNTTRTPEWADPDWNRGRTPSAARASQPTQSRDLSSTSRVTDDSSEAGRPNKRKMAAQKETVENDPPPKTTETAPSLTLETLERALHANTVQIRQEVRRTMEEMSERNDNANRLLDLRMETVENTTKAAIAQMASDLKGSLEMIMAEQLARRTQTENEKLERMELRRRTDAAAEQVDKLSRTVHEQMAEMAERLQAMAGPSKGTTRSRGKGTASSRISKPAPDGTEIGFLQETHTERAGRPRRIRSRSRSPPQDLAQEGPSDHDQESAGDPARS